MRAKRCASWATLLLLSLPWGVSHAQVQLDWGGLIQSNVRFQYDDVTAGNFYDERKFGKGVARNEHIFKFRGSASTDRFAGVWDIDFVWLNFQRDVSTFDDLTLRENVEPTRFEAHAAYIEGLDFLFDGLDIRVGQQVVSWGVGDGFNPTNNLNADDVEDRLLYGIQQANLMGKLSYTYEDYFSIEAVVVPVFRPALFPQSGALALALVDRVPVLDEAFRHRLISENGYAGSDEIFAFAPLRQPTTVSNLIVQTPDAGFTNVQFGFQVATTLYEQDIALSYYQGFADFPVPVQNVTRFDENNPRTVCMNGIDPNDDTLDADVRRASCVSPLETTTTLNYPRMRVVGLNVSGEVDALGWISDDINPIGYRFELGIHFPEEKRLRLVQEGVEIAGFDVSGEYDYNGIPDGIGEAPLVLDDTPYAKWVLGLDYSFGSHVYANVQWVHGLAEEIGAGDWISEGYTVRQSSAQGGFTQPGDPVGPVSLFRCVLWNQPVLGQRSAEAVDPGACAKEILRPRIGDYLVLGLDFIFDRSRGLFRLFTIFDLTPMIQEEFDPQQNRRVTTDISPFSKEGFSMVLFPELNYNFGGGFELATGALMFFGRDYTKFGDPAAGGSIIWTRGRYSF